MMVAEASPCQAQPQGTQRAREMGWECGRGSSLVPGRPERLSPPPRVPSPNFSGCAEEGTGWHGPWDREPVGRKMEAPVSGGWSERPVLRHTEASEPGTGDCPGHRVAGPLGSRALTSRGLPAV